MSALTRFVIPEAICARLSHSHQKILPCRVCAAAGAAVLLSPVCYVSLPASTASTAATARFMSQELTGDNHTAAPSSQARSNLAQHGDDTGRLSAKAASFVPASGKRLSVAFSHSRHASNISRVLASNELLLDRQHVRLRTIQAKEAVSCRRLDQEAEAPA